MPGRREGARMPDLKKMTIQGAVKVFRGVRMVVVACVCLLIVFSARQLFDAYVPERIPFLEKERLDAEVQVIPIPQQDLPVSHEPAEKRVPPFKRGSEDSSWSYSAPVFF
jgi:hypothetical protein